MGFGFRIWSLGFRVEGLRLRVYGFGLGCGAKVLGLKVQGLGYFYRVLGLTFSWPLTFSFRTSITCERQRGVDGSGSILTRPAMTELGRLRLRSPDVQPTKDEITRPVSREKRGLSDLGADLEVRDLRHLPGKKVQQTPQP